MKLTLTLEGSTSQLAAVIALLDGHNMTASVAMPTAPLPVPISDDGEDGPTNVNAPATDAKGLPWDGRIHAKTKVINADGSWRMRRGVDEATVISVEAELLGTMGATHAPAPVPVPIPMPVAVAEPVPIPMPVAVAEPVPIPEPVPISMPVAVAEPVALPVAAPVQVPVPVAVAPAPVEAAPAPGQLDFNQFMQHLGMQMQKRDESGAPLIHTDYLAALTVEISNAFITAGHITAPLVAFTDISTNPEMIAYATQLMQRDGRW